MAAVVCWPGAANAQRRREPPPATTTPPANATPSADATPARTAADTAQARAYFQQGQAAYARGEYEEAIQAWQQAFAVDPVPLLQYNLAQAYGRLGDIPNELATLRRFIEMAPPNDTNIAPSRMRIAALEERMARTGIELAGVASDAEVSIDGDVIPVPPVGAIVAPEPGSHRIHVRLRGHRPFDAVVDVIPGHTSEVRVDQPAIVQPSAPVLAYVLLGVGGAAVLTGATTGAISFSNASDAFVGTPDGTRYHRMGLASDVLIGVGAAAAATGLVLVLVRDRGESDEYDVAHARFVPYASTTGAGIAIDGRF